MKLENELRSQGDRQLEYEDPLLLDAEDLRDVAGGCWFGCSDGSCQKK